MNARFNKISIALIALAVIMIPSPGFTGIYQWVDEQGKRHFSQTPPPDQTNQHFEKVEVVASDSATVDSSCCMAIRQVGNKMLLAKANGATITDLYGFYHPDLGDLRELANFIVNRYDSGIRPTEISRMTFDACRNGAFKICKTKSAEDSGIDASGSGFSIDDNGNILTNYHVVKACSRIRVFPDGDDAKLIAKNTDLDLAVIRSPNKTAASAGISGAPAERGQAVVVAGFPYRGELSSGIHITTGTISSLQGVKDDPDTLQISAPVQPGNSGGPLLNESGQVIGVVSSKLNALYFAKKYKDVPTNVSFAIKANVVRKFLESNQIDYSLVSSTVDPMKTTEISALAEKFTVAIECKH